MAGATVYIETSVLSYLAARPSRDVIVLAQQQFTNDWWEGQRGDYELYVSTIVIEEAASGNIAAQKRLALLANVNIREVSDEATQLAARLVESKTVPRKAVQDALHIAVASVNQMQYLLTWNYKHIANATMRASIDQICRKAGYEPPIICTPAELGGSDVG